MKYNWYCLIMSYQGLFILGFSNWTYSLLGEIINLVGKCSNLYSKYSYYKMVKYKLCYDCVWYVYDLELIN